MASVVINLPPLPINRLDSVSTIADLRAVSSGAVADGADIAVDGGQASGDGLGGLFSWSELSVLADDGATVIRPNDVPPLSAGRWILLGGNSIRSSNLVQTSRSSLGIYAATRTQTSKNNDRFDLRDYAGLDLSGDNSMTTLVQRAFNDAISQKALLHVPVGKITLDATINITDSLSVIGESPGTGKASSGASGLAVTSATQFHFAHNGKGFALNGNGVPFDWVVFRDIMTSRVQPEPTSVVGSFTPGDQDYDFDVFGCSGLQLQNVCMLNPARGINMRGGGGIGRLWTDNLFGQPLRVGVNVELCADVLRMDNTHFWPFWKDHVEVARWTLRNCDHLYLKRCDTPLISNFFSIGARSWLRVGTNGFGGMGKLKASNVDVDYGGKNIWFDSTAQNCWAYLTNVSLQGAVPTALANTPGLTDRINVLMEGTGANYLFMNGVEMSSASGSAISLATANQNCQIGGGFWLQEYGNASQAGHTNTDPAINVVANSKFSLSGEMLNTLPGLGPLVGGAGRHVGLRKSYVPGVTPQSGSYTDASLIDAQFIENGYEVSGTVNVLVANAGAATGYVDIGLPTPIDIAFGVTAMDATDNTPLVAVTLAGTPGVVRIRKPGGGNVGVSGHTINMTFYYSRKAG